MSAKVKIFSIISAFILVLGIMIIGVLSAEQVQVNIGGSVSFNATNVYAKVSGNISGAETGNKTFSTLTYSAEETTGDESDWINLALEFTETPDPIVITITVENLSDQRTLTVNLENTLQGEGLNIATTRDGGSYASGYNVELGTADSATASTTFTLTLSVTNANEDLTNVTFGYILNMYDESVAPAAPTPASSFTFSFNNTNHTATITGFVGSETEVMIPSMVSKVSDTTATEGSEYSVTSIDRIAFQNCTSLISITIPSSVIAIDDSSFIYCSSLTSIEVDSANTAYSSEDGVLFNKDKTTLIQYPIGNTRTKYIIPASVTSIGVNAFYECSTLTQVTIPEGVQNIGDGAFCDCNGLTSITIPDSVTSIGYVSFMGCENVASLTIGGGVESIGPSAFVNCNNLIEINYNAINANDLVSNSDIFISSGRGEITVNIGPNVTRIPAYVFKTSGITSVDFTENNQCQEIGDYAFFGCNSLTSVNFGDNSQLLSIGDYAFAVCPMSLTSITIPDSVTSIGMYAFNGCQNLTSITVNAITPPTLGSIAIPDNVTNIYVPADSVSAYQSASGWSNYSSKISAIV